MTLLHSHRCICTCTYHVHVYIMYMYMHHVYMYMYMVSSVPGPHVLKPCITCRVAPIPLFAYTHFAYTYICLYHEYRHLYTNTGTYAGICLIFLSNYTVLALIVLYLKLTYTHHNQYKQNIGTLYLYFAYTIACCTNNACSVIHVSGAHNKECATAGLNHSTKHLPY